MIHETDRYGTATSSAPLNRGPQPGWLTLNQARDRGFTGEIVFETEPEVRTYLDNGVVYFAERDSDGSLAHRLVQSGVLDHGQIERGTVRVGDVEHLGRLFDREPSVDRDAVLVLTEALTDELVTELANEVITTVRSTAYRHHPSGLHRWFVTPVETTAELRPGMVSSLEASVLDDLPGLPMIGERLITDQLYIDWDEPVVGGSPAVVEEESFVETFDDSALEAMLDEAVADDLSESERVTLWTPGAAEILYHDEIVDEEVEDLDELIDLRELSDDSMAVDEPMLAIDFQSASWPTPEIVAFPIIESFDDGEVDEEFHVVWPSGAVEVIVAEDPTPPQAAVQTIDEPVATTADDLSMTPIESFEDEMVADVPADVADAVKRAIAALEAASVAAPTVSPIMQPADFHQAEAAPAPSPIVTADAAPAGGPAGGAFAPPSLDMSAEAIYARMAAEQETLVREASFEEAPVIEPFDFAEVDLEPRLPNTVLAGAVPAGVASVVFVDDETTDDDDGSDDRSSALRRLIGSLRRKDR
jgi:hypothetical protein